MILSSYLLGHRYNHKGSSPACTLLYPWHTWLLDKLAFLVQPQQSLWVCTAHKGIADMTCHRHPGGVSLTRGLDRLNPNSEHTLVACSNRNPGTWSIW